MKRAPIDFGERAEKMEDLPAGEVAREARVLGKVTDAGEGCVIADRAAEDSAVASSGTDNSHDDFDESAFAGAVGAEEAEDFACVNANGDAAQVRDAAAVDFGDVAEIDRGWGVGHKCGRNLATDGAQ